MIRTAGVLAAAVAMVAGGASIAGAQTAGAGGRIDWGPCAESASVDCGSLRLPINWAKPKGEKFDLAVARRKATDPRKRIGVLIINPGGPGGSGVDFALGADRFFSPDVLARFDIIGFDPRGVARSQPVKCSLEVLNKQPSLYPNNQREFEALAAYNRELAADCRKHSGPMADYADTKSVVRDIDALRVALGERKINYFGVSYGTLIGQQYAEEFGRNVRAMVIDSNMDHSAGTARFGAVSAATAEDSFREFVRWCERTTSCALHGKDVTKWWDQLLAKADRGELVDPSDPTHVITAAEISRFAFSAFYGPDWTLLADVLASLETGAPQRAAYGTEELVENPFTAVFCKDWDIRVKNHRELAALTDRANRLAPHMRGSALGHVATTGCVGLPAATNPQHDLNITTAPKILMLNALHDPATGYDWAVNAHRQSRDTTVLVTYEGWGHGVYPRSECTIGITDTYLFTLRTPRDGTRCAAVEPPVGPSIAAAPSLPRPAGPLPGLPGWVK
ncbi:pimeloyl-ACP methyl ester carboxylesterase [Actinokineospora baliensis]|uniref:alpha/beta hydrolase n=1 Tax=Actinokineospora baliensis TaxID=547056 RepID=UPI001EF78F5F|nr:alpha/beta hydrolase [Actinokineospora baliensis]MBM7772233.1 pimeloyl-ACP methyl ester carboxylesterase [Actinokineospora baliensis]